MEQHTYPYKRLPFSKGGHRYIRILVLHPRLTFETDLKADLVDVCLCRCSRTYEAVSYAWGTEDAIHTITIGGYRHSIRPNLFQCLQQLSSTLHHSRRRLWIDALCIDQFDNRERARQVALMRGIFANADSTIAWLGCESQDDAGLAHHLIFARDQSRNFSGSIPKSDSSLKARELLTKLFERRWFQRRWVIQEVAASRKYQITIQLGGYSMHFYDLQHYVRREFSSPLDGGKRQIQAISTVLMEQDEVTPIGQTVCDAFKSYHGGEDSPTDRAFVWRYFHADAVLLTDSKRVQTKSAVETVKVLDKFHSHECQDDRDRIAALSGLNGSMMFTVDYEATVEDNYVAFASTVARNGGGFQLMRSALRRRDHFQERRLPSWVPDWRFSLRHEPHLSDISETASGEPAKLHVDGARLMLSADAVRSLTAAEVHYVKNWLSDSRQETHERASQRSDTSSLVCMDLFTPDDPTSKLATLVLAFQGGNDGVFELLLEMPHSVSIVSRPGISLDPELIDRDDNSLREILLATQNEYIYID